MAKINIDNKEYDTDNLSDEAKGNLAALQFVEMEIQRTQALLASFQTSRNAYANALKQALEKTPSNSSSKPFEVSSGQTLKFT